MRKKPYTWRTVLWDILWLCLTSGLWIFYIPLREMRLRSH